MNAPVRQLATAPALPAAALALLFLVANGFFSPGFVAVENLPAQLINFSPFVLAALATMPSVLSGGGGIDISIGPLMSLANVVLVTGLMPHDVSVVASIVIVLGMTAAVGFANGVLIAVLRYPPIIATLCMYFILQGVILTIAPAPVSAPKNWTEELSNSWGPFPVVSLLLLAPVVVWLLLRTLPFMTALYSVGGNDTAAFASGVPIRKIRILAYTLGGLFAGVGGIALTALIQSADTSLAASYTLAAPAAVVLGGTVLAGGRGGFTGTLLGALAIFLLQGLLAGLNVPATWLGISYGAVLLFGLVMTALTKDLFVPRGRFA